MKYCHNSSALTHWSSITGFPDFVRISYFGCDIMGWFSSFGSELLSQRGILVTHYNPKYKIKRKDFFSCLCSFLTTLAESLTHSHLIFWTPWRESESDHDHDYDQLESQNCDVRSILRLWCFFLEYLASNEDKITRRDKYVYCKFTRLSHETETTAQCLDARGFFGFSV